MAEHGSGTDEREQVSTALDVLPTAAVVTGPQLPRTVASLIAEVIARGWSPQTKRADAGDLDDFLTWWLHRVGHPYRSHSVRADPDAMTADGRVAAHLDSTLQALQLVTERDIQQYLHHLEGTVGPNDQPLHAPATLNRRLTPLRLLFSRLHRHSLIAVNPLEDVRGRKTSNASTTVYLTRNQARELIAACAGPRVSDLRDRAIILLMLTSGLRASEVVSIDVADLQLVEEHYVVWVKGKGGARERVKVQPHAWQAITAYLTAAALTNGPLFRRVHAVGPRKQLVPGTAQDLRIGENRLSYTGLYALLQERFLKAGFVASGPESSPQAPSPSRQRKYGAKVSAPRLALHSLRHTHITLAIRGGASLPVVQKGARHQNVQTTMRYARDMDSLDDAAGDYVKL
jgi:site-specific recombinase XerD